LQAPEDLAILVTLAKGDTENAGVHANLLGPIFINMQKRIGLQKGLNNVESAVVIRAS
jgi:flagellar assembly factor FliW